MPEGWRKRVGGHGHTVLYGERDPGGLLYLFVPRKGQGGYDMKSLGHTNEELAEQAAKKLSGQLLAARRSMKEGKRPIAVVLARYEQDVSKFKKGAQPAEDRRRIVMWLAFFGTGQDARKITRNDMTRFVRQRRAGAIRIPPEQLGSGKVRERSLKPHPSDATVGADIIFLDSVLNWAVEERLIKRNPIAGFDRPRAKNPKQPVATFDRFLAVYTGICRNDRDGLFREFFLLIGNELDWRVSALCKVRPSDIDLRQTDAAPWGQVWKNSDADKEGVEGWVPLSFRARRAFMRALRKRKAIGNAPLFESPKRPGQPWSRWHARDLLERAESWAGVGQIDGGDFHPYRRKWSSERRHHPWADIAAVSGRKDRRTFERSYAKADTVGTLAVVTDARRVRAPKLGQKLKHGSQETNSPTARNRSRAVS